MSTVETVPTVWSAGDERFFRIVAGLLSPGFLFGAGVLLASHDAEPLAGHCAAAREAGPAWSAPAGLDGADHAATQSAGEGDRTDKSLWPSAQPPAT